ncbi:MAG: hypothetical protein AAGD07_10300 [Planctomycetota bacterium]
MATSSLQKLKQADAARLMGVSARTLRDMGEVPRNEDGTYDAIELMAWARGRATLPSDIPPGDLERVLLVSDRVWLNCDSMLAAAVTTLTELRQKHGNAICEIFANNLLQRWQGVVELEEQLEQDPTFQRREREREQERRRVEDAERDLRITLVCGECGKKRRGLTWGHFKTPKEHVEEEGCCPGCE